MRDGFPDTVTPGGPSAPLGARGEGARGEAAPEDETRAAGTAAEPGATRPSPDRGAARMPPLLGSARALGTMLVVSLLAYAAIATDVVHGGRLTDADESTAEWVARTMPAWAEWTARPFSWIGGSAGAAFVVVVAVVWLVHRRERVAAGLLVAVAAGSQVLVTTGKRGYDRARPTAGSPIDLPTSFSFPSGHAATGIAVFGLLGLLLGQRLPTRATRAVATAAGFGVGAAIGGSRVVLGVHFVSDVLAGAALALAWLSACLLAVALVSRSRRR
jgi:membrane-associated phospholipid phosphatase